MVGLNILILDGNTRQSLPICKALKKKGHKITLLCVSELDLGYHSKWPDKKIIGKNPKTEREEYYQFLMNLIKENGYDIVLPLFDYSAEIVSKYKKNIEQYSFVAVNDWDVFVKAREKSKTMKICENNNIPHPKTLEVFELKEKSKNKIGLPFLLKPNIGDSARGIRIINDYKEFDAVYDAYVEEYGEMLIQEYIPQTDKQYKAELYLDREGRLIRGIVFEKVRWYPLSGGSSTFNVTVYSDQILSQCYKLLKAMEWKGYADVDLIFDPRDDSFKVMEINPRITGSVKIAFEAGVDFVGVIVDEYKGNKVEVDLKYDKNVCLRFLYKDLLWLIFSKVSILKKIKWFDFRRNYDQIIDFSDPFPALMYLRYTLNYFRK